MGQKNVFRPFNIIPALRLCSLEKDLDSLWFVAGYMNFFKVTIESEFVVEVSGD